MFIVSLIASPVRRDLGAAFVDSLHNAWKGGDAVWLAPDEAAEFEIAEVPGNREDAWRDAQAMGIDLNVVPAIGRKKALLLADMDSTMIRQECIDELAIAAGVGDQVIEITKRAMNGELDFEGAVIERVGLLKGLKTSEIDTVLADRITLTSGGKTLLNTHKANGGYAALVSGGFTQFTRSVAARLGFDEHRANTLLTDGEVLTGEVARPILGREAKVSAMAELCDSLVITNEDVLAVGDGANDLGMLTAAGMGVALHAKPSVAAQANIRINHGDLTSLLFLQGYAQTDFVS